MKRKTRSVLLILTLLAILGLLSALAQKPSTSFTELAAQAQRANDENRLADASLLYAQALNLRPSWAEGWWALGNLAYDQDQYAKAASAFEKFVTLQPKNGTGHAMLGLCEFELGHNQSALKHLQSGKDLGLQKNPELWHVVLFHEGILLQRKGAFQAAQDTLEELCLQMGSNDKAAAILGMTMLRMNAKNPPAPDSTDGTIVLRVGRAQCLAGQKKYDEARPDFESVVQENPTHPNIHYAFGLFLLEIRDVAAGVEQLKQEIANDPTDVLARLRIAAAEYKQDSTAGLPFAEEAVKLDPKQPFAHMLLGLLRLDVDDYLNAIPELEIARKSLPNEPKIYAALGTAYSRAGRQHESVEARQIFAKLAEVEKKQAEANARYAPRISNKNQITVEDLPPDSH